MSVTTYLQQSSFDHGIAVILMVIDHDGAIGTISRNLSPFLQGFQS
jgi:hypothetical protein